MKIDGLGPKSLVEVDGLGPLAGQPMGTMGLSCINYVGSTTSEEIAIDGAV